MEIMLTASLGHAAPAIDFSIWNLFLRADFVVKAVMIGLVLASIWSWAIIIDKINKLRRVKQLTSRFEDVFWSGTPLEDLYQQVGHKPGSPIEMVFSSAMREWRRSMDKERGPLLGGIMDRIDRVMTVTINREIGRLESHINFLATVGATAVFVGLFGTVWGIMNAMRAIGVSEGTNLAVVAPGIAEALFATALGLLAALPATVAYNRFSNSINDYGSRLEGFADEFAAILSRQIDERRRQERGGGDRVQA